MRYLNYQRVATVCLLVLSLALLCFGQEIHVVDPGTMSNAPVSPAEMNKRIEEAAVEYKEYAPIPRIVFYDIAYPLDAREYEELGGHAVLLISALSQDRAELPLKRLFVRLNGAEIELKLITSVLSTRSEDKSRTLATFGPYRVDALYLLPAYLRDEKADLLADFAKNRDGFKLASFADSEPVQAGYPFNRFAPGKSPSEVALKQFIQREYPGFIKK